MIKNKNKNKNTLGKGEPYGLAYFVLVSTSNIR